MPGGDEGLDFASITSQKQKGFPLGEKIKKSGTRLVLHCFDESNQFMHHPEMKKRRQVFQKGEGKKGAGWKTEGGGGIITICAFRLRIKEKEEGR